MITKILVVLCLVAISLQGRSDCIAEGTSVLELGCDKQRICQSSCNYETVKCSSPDLSISRGTFKELQGRKYFVPPFPIEIRVEGLDDAYDLACVKHSTAKATLLKILDNVRKDAEYNLTIAIEKDQKLKKKLTKEVKKYKKKTQKQMKKLKKIVKPGQDHSKVRNAYVKLSQDSIAFGPLNSLKSEYLAKKIKFLQDLINLMNPQDEFVDFWAKLREFCVKKINGKLPIQRILEGFYQAPFKPSTRKIITDLNAASNFVDKLGLKSQIIEDTKSSSPGVIKGPKDEIEDKFESYITKTFGEFPDRTNQVGLVAGRGASTLGRGGHGHGHRHGNGHGNRGNQGNGQKPANPNTGAQNDQNPIRPMPFGVNPNAVVDLLGYLADWATSKLNQRCPCSHVQNIIIKGIAPDGSKHPEIPKKYNVGQLVNKNQPDFSSELLKKKDSICFTTYPNVCKKRLPGDDIDISDDDLLGAIAKGQMPDCSGALANTPRCLKGNNGNGKQKFQEVLSLDGNEEVLGIFVEPE